MSSEDEVRALFAELFEAYKTQQDSKFAEEQSKFATARDEAAAEAAALQKEVENLRKENQRLKENNADEAEEDKVYMGYLPSENPHSRRPNNAKLAPHAYDQYGDCTTDLLEKQSGSATWHENRNLGPALSYLWETRRVFQDYYDDWQAVISDKLGEDAALGLEGVYNTLDGVYAMLVGRMSIIKIRTRAANEAGGVAEQTKLLLEFMESRLYGLLEGEALGDDRIEGWLREYTKLKSQAELKKAAGAGKSKTKTESESGMSSSTTGGTSEKAKKRRQARAKGAGTPNEGKA